MCDLDGKLGRGARPSVLSCLDLFLGESGSGVGRWVEVKICFSFLVNLDRRRRRLVP